MSADFSDYDADMRTFAEELLRFDTTGGDELAASEWLESQLDGMGFETYTWTADAEELAAHPSFPDDPDELRVADRPSVAGVAELGDPDEGPTVVLNGHFDVVPAERGSWDTDPFEPAWDAAEAASADPNGVDTSREGEFLTARGAADMKSGLAACVFAARYLADHADESGVNGRVVAECVVGEEEGGIGAAAAALSNPYPFERDAAIVAEPTKLAPIVATEGSLMKRLTLHGRSAHAASKWCGESVLPHFERIRRAFEDLETERGERVTHPLYGDFPIPWPVCFGIVNAGTWSSSVPARLTAEIRIGVAPGETVADVEAEYEALLEDIVAESEWLSAHPPEFERFSVQFEPAETDPDEPVVGAVRDAMRAHGLPDTEPRGATYGADSRWFVEAGIPTVIFGPGTIDQAHFPNETIHWREVRTAGEVIADAARGFLAR